MLCDATFRPACAEALGPANAARRHRAADDDLGAAPGRDARGRSRSLRALLFRTFRRPDAAGGLWRGRGAGRAARRDRAVPSLRLSAPGPDPGCGNADALALSARPVRPLSAE